MVSLLDFLRTGRLGEVGLGATQTDVELTFGPPERWDSRGHFARSLYWRYGDIELRFQQNVVELLIAEGFDVPTMGDVPFDPWKVRRSCTWDEFKGDLNTQSIPFQSGWGFVDANNQVLVDNDEGSWWIHILDSNVVLRFDGWPSSQSTMTSFWCR